MIEMAATLVAHCGSNFFRDSVQVLQQVFDLFAAQLRKFAHGLVEIGNISRVMFVMMNFHRARIDMRFEGVERIREGWESKRSGGALSGRHGAGVKGGESGAGNRAQRDR